MLEEYRLYQSAWDLLSRRNQTSVSHSCRLYRIWRKVDIKITTSTTNCRRKRSTFCAGATTKTRRRSHRRTKPKDLLISCAVSGNMTCVHCASSTPIRCCAMFYSVGAFRNDPRPLPTLPFSWSLVLLLRPRGTINSFSWSEKR